MHLLPVVCLRSLREGALVDGDHSQRRFAESMDFTGVPCSPRRTGCVKPPFTGHVAYFYPTSQDNLDYLR